MLIFDRYSMKCLRSFSGIFISDESALLFAALLRAVLLLRFMAMDSVDCDGVENDCRSFDPGMNVLVGEIEIQDFG